MNRIKVKGSGYWYRATLQSDGWHVRVKDAPDWIIDPSDVTDLG